MPTYDTTGPIDLDATLGVGLVELIASDRDDVTVEVVPSRPGRSGDVSLARDATVSFDGGRLRITVPRRLNLFGQSDSVDVRCELPTGSRVAIENAYGSVNLRGRFGDSRVVAKYGNVNADTVDDLVLESPHGTIDVAQVTGRLDGTVGHGLVNVRRVGGEVRLRGSHGPIELGTTGGSVTVATSGALTIGRALGDVTARSAHGPVRIREVSGGSIRIENGHADVEVGVPAGLAAWIDAFSAHGRVRNELTPDADAANTGRHVELRLRADYADVVIRRATDLPEREATA
ncbi:DUF4097 family beta strand repeat-containing protein [Micromonospora sp. NPDC003241]